MANLNALQNCINNVAAGPVNSIQYNNGSGSLGAVGPLTDGQLLIGMTGGAPQAALLTPGAGIIITKTPGGITISSSGGSAVTPTLVQSAFDRESTGSSTGTVTLPSAPTPGNLLVAFASGFAANNLAPSPAFNTVYISLGNVGQYQGVAVGARVVQSGDGDTWTGFSGGNGGNLYGVLELAGGHAVQVTGAPGTQSGSNWPFFAGTAGSSYNFFVLENDSANAFGSITGASLLFDGSGGSGSNGNHPSVVATIPSGTAANAAINYSGSNFGQSIICTVSVMP